MAFKYKKVTFMNKIKKNKIYIVFIILLILLILAAGFLFIKPLRKIPSKIISRFHHSGEYITDIEERTIVLPGLKNTYRFMFVSDLHLLTINDEVSDASLEEIRGRYELSSANGHSAADTLPAIIKKANELKPDAVLFGGDMLDFLSEENAKILSENLDKLEVPYMYVTADHDICCWWTDYTSEEEASLRELLPASPVQVMDYDEFVILGISDNTSQLTPEALSQIKDVFATGKPVIVMQHVPVDSDTEDSETLRILSKQNWGDRVLLWGEGDYYDPDEPTKEYLELLLGPSSNVAAVLAGHLHFRYEGKITDTATQYIFNPAYSGEIAVFTVTGE